MKKLLALLSVLAIMLLSLTGCDTDKTSNKNNADKKPQQSNSQTDNEQKPADNTENNYFLNEGNNILEPNAVSVRPKYVYWQDGKLIAVCFVINGFSNNVYNIEVKSLEFSNGSGVIASASFGALTNLSLAPNTHAEWTFEFGADCIQNYGSDITSLEIKYSTSYSY